MNSNSDLHQDDMTRIDTPHQAGQTVSVSHEQEELGPLIHDFYLTTESLDSPNLCTTTTENNVSPCKFQVVVPKIGLVRLGGLRSFPR